MHISGLQNVKVGVGDEFRVCRPAVTSLLDKFRVCHTITAATTGEIDISCSDRGYYLMLRSNQPFNFTEIVARGTRAEGSAPLQLHQTSCSPYDSTCYRRICWKFENIYSTPLKSFSRFIAANITAVQMDHCHCLFQDPLWRFWAPTPLSIRMGSSRLLQRTILWTTTSQLLLTPLLPLAVSWCSTWKSISTSQISKSMFTEVSRPWNWICFLR